MTQIFGPKADLAVRLTLIGMAIGIPLLFVAGSFWVRSSWWTEKEAPPPQPVPFSHRHHVGGLDIACRYCHTSVEDSATAGLPSTDICMTCHSQLWTNAAALAPVRESLRTGEPLRWRRVHDLPDFAYFNHSIHVNKGVACETCHGRVDRMALTAKANDMHMQWCLDCHRNPEPNLRPPEAVFAMGWRPPADEPDLGARLAEAYHLNRQIMVDCSTCHR